MAERVFPPKRRTTVRPYLLGKDGKRLPRRAKRHRKRVDKARSRRWKCVYFSMEKTDQKREKQYLIDK
jgi:hypothetical protein